MITMGLHLMFVFVWITVMVTCAHQTNASIIEGFYNNTQVNVMVTCAVPGNVVPWCLDATGTWIKFTGTTPCPNPLLYINECLSSQPVAACSSSPCLNGGACVNAGLGYQCNCPSGYTGNNCQTYAACSSSPCLNGGQCTNVGLGYQCNCPSGYSGNNCQTFGPCSSSPCLNGGQCVNLGLGLYQCNCPSGYTGNNCQASAAPSIYFIERGQSGGYISTFTSSGVQARLSPSGGSDEVGVAVDTVNNMIYYTMNVPNSLWRASLGNVSGTKVQIWIAPTYADGLALSTTDQLIFVDQDRGVTMLNYGVTSVNTLYVNKRISNGLVVDQNARILYFTDEINNQIWMAAYTPSRWAGSATVILSGAGSGQVGLYPEGMVLDAGTLYWVLLDTAEVRAMPIGGSSSVTVVPGGPNGVYSYGLAKQGSVFYYTSATSTGGVFQTTVNGTRTRITPNTTLYTDGITVV